MPEGVKIDPGHHPLQQVRENAKKFAVANRKKGVPKKPAIPCCSGTAQAEPFKRR